VRRWVFAAGIAVVLVIVGAAVYALWFRTDTTVTPFGVEEALAELASEPAGSEPAGSEPAELPVLPAVGVYTYTTRGGDQIDALGGASHTYPETSTLTVRAMGCGVSQRWVAAGERYDEYEVCPADDGVALVGWTEFHRFFGTDDRQSYECSGDPRPLGAPAGTTWTTTCRRDGEIGVWTGEVLDPETTILVDGDSVAAEHVVWTIDNGDPDDVVRIETWFMAGTDLVLRRAAVATTVEGSPVGDVHYGEIYEITLRSLTPTR
jgi:hypothetical protein